MDLKFNDEIKYCEVCGKPLNKKVVINLYVKTIEMMVLIPCQCEIDKEEKKKVKEENQRKQERLLHVQKNSLMDKKLKEQTFKNWNHEIGSQKLFDFAKKYVENFNQATKEGLGFYLYGPTGCGKTFSVSCIANELKEKFVPFICISSIKLLGRIKDTFNSKSSDSQSSVINNLDNAKLLIIDDLGAEVVSDWSKSIIYEIVDTRIRKQLPLIITSNLEPEELKEIYGMRIYERIIYQACVPIENSLGSLRRFEGEEKIKILSEIINK